MTAGPKAGPPPDVNVALSEIDKIARAKTVRTWVGYAPDASGKTRVMFSWEPVTGGPGEAAPVGEPVSQVTVMAVNESEGPVYRGKVPAAAASADAVSRRRPDVVPHRAWRGAGQGVGRRARAAASCSRT